jgi:hypothetical protein
VLARVATTGLDRSVPVPPDAAFYVLLESAYACFRLTKIDDGSKTCEFSTGMSPFTGRTHFVARVVPSAEGTSIRIQGFGKLARSKVQAHSTKLINQLLDEVVDRLRSAWQ